MSRAALGLLGFALSMRIGAAETPSRYGIDAPELARLGSHAVGVRWVHTAQQVEGRELDAEVWYPALPPVGAEPVRYEGSLTSEPPAPPARFTIPGLAVKDAPVSGKGFPLVVISHGMSNDVACFTWLTENLASKGYVVAAIRHDDPPITDRARFGQVVLDRPLDVAVAARSLAAELGAEHLVDPARIALIGYSMGGYGVLVAAGAVLDPHSAAAQMVPGGALLPYAAGGARRGELDVPGLRAVIAIAPFGGPQRAYGATGLAGIHTPLLLIAGSADRRVGYTEGARAFFDQAVNARRYLLTFEGAGHSIGLGPAPQSMRQRLWDQDWFADPVWRTERVNAINAHFITAFLDRFVKDDETRAAYLDVAVPEASEGRWPDPPSSASPAPWGAYSPGTAGITVWKGFQRSQATGLELLGASPAGS